MEEQAICLDTSVLIDYYRKKNKENSFFYKLAGEYDVFAISVITEYEIYIGSNDQKDEYWNVFFSKIISLPYDSESNKIAIKLDRQLKKSRKQIDTPNLMIAACALANNLKLATLNPKHFQRISELQLITAPA